MLASRELTSGPRARALALIEALTVGLPFCVFKIAAGVLLLDTSARGGGWALIALGAVDTLLNALNAAAVTIVGDRRVPVCLLQAIAIRARPSSRAGEIGAALDVVLSFALVAAVVGMGKISLFSARWLSLWNLAVVVNVLGAGVLRFMNALTPAPRQQRSGP